MTTAETVLKRKSMQTVQIGFELGSMHETWSTRRLRQAKAIDIEP